MAKNDVDKLHKQKEGGGKNKPIKERWEKCVGAFSTPNSGRRIGEREEKNNNEGHNFRELIISICLLSHFSNSAILTQSVFINCFYSVLNQVQGGTWLFSQLLRPRALARTACLATAVRVWISSSGISPRFPAASSPLDVFAEFTRPCTRRDKVLLLQD